MPGCRPVAARRRLLAELAEFLRGIAAGPFAEPSTSRPGSGRCPAGPLIAGWPGAGRETAAGVHGVGEARKREISFTPREPGSSSGEQEYTQIAPHSSLSYSHPASENVAPWKVPAGGREPARSNIRRGTITRGRSIPKSFHLTDAGLGPIVFFGECGLTGGSWASRRQGAGDVVSTRSWMRWWGSRRPGHQKGVFLFKIPLTG